MTPKSERFQALVDLMAALRAPDGCPWDREQTLESLKAYLIEEAYETLDVMDEESGDKHKEELGDLLFQIIFQAQIRNELGDFDIYDVADAIVEKMTRRHPHVFGDGPKAESAEAAYGQWERIKQAERRASHKKKASVLQGVPKHLPALLKALRITDKASRVGFDWEKTDDVLHKVDEELKELHDAIEGQDPRQIEDELGDLLFTLVNVARFLDINPEEALQKSTQKFSNRFMAMEEKLAQSGHKIEERPMAELNTLWEAVKGNSPRNEDKS